MTPIESARSVWEKVRTNRVILIYIAVVVTIILYLVVTTEAAVAT